jgi:hypothetical protein
VYGRRYLSFSEVNVLRHRFPWICKFQKGSPALRKKTWSCRMRAAARSLGG